MFKIRFIPCFTMKFTLSYVGRLPFCMITRDRHPTKEGDCDRGISCWESLGITRVFQSNNMSSTMMAPITGDSAHSGKAFLSGQSQNFDYVDSADLEARLQRKNVTLGQGGIVNDVGKLLGPFYLFASVVMLGEHSLWSQFVGSYTYRRGEICACINRQYMLSHPNKSTKLVQETMSHHTASRKFRSTSEQHGCKEPPVYCRILQLRTALIHLA